MSLIKNLSDIFLELIYLFTALHKFGYGDKFIHLFKVPYANIKSKIKTNSLLSDPLALMLVRQWCLLSILLYNIAAEVLSNFINTDKSFKGIQIGDHEIKVVNFADNTTIFLRRDVICLNTSDFKTI